MLGGQGVAALRKTLVRNYHRAGFRACWGGLEAKVVAGRMRRLGNGPERPQQTKHQINISN